MLFTPEIHERALYTLVTQRGREIALYYRCAPYQWGDCQYDWAACDLLSTPSANDNSVYNNERLPDAGSFVLAQDDFDCVLATFRNISSKRPHLMDLFLGLQGLFHCIDDYEMPLPVWMTNAKPDLVTHNVADVMVRVLHQFNNINSECGRYFVRGNEPFFTDDINEAMLRGMMIGTTIIDLETSLLA